MNFHHLKSIDPTLEMVKGDAHSIRGICDFHQISDHSILFVKNQNFVKKLEELKEIPTSLLIIFEKKIYHSSFEKLPACIATIHDVSDAMCSFSYLFFQKKFSGINHFVDGRQMGTTTIDPTTMISQGVFIGENVTIGKNVVIHPGVTIMAGAKIDDHVEIFPNVTIYPNVQIGKRVRIHGGSCIGADGFGYHFKAGEHKKIWHMGSTILEDDVEVGANSCVDGGTFSPTIIGAGTKIDNHVQIAHNCVVGKNVILCGHVALAGSCEIGDYTVIAGQASVSTGIKVGKQVTVAAYSGVTTNAADGAKIGGFPGRDLKTWMRELVTLKKLTESKTTRG